jgi:hypothetical protein
MAASHPRIDTVLAMQPNRLKEILGEGGIADPIRRSSRSSATPVRRRLLDGAPQLRRAT